MQLTRRLEPAKKYFDLSRRETRDAARLAVQSAAAAAAAFILLRATGVSEEFVGVLSAVLVVQPSVGDTLGEAWDRFLSTLVGSAIGIACLFILPSGYGTAAALAISMLVTNAVAGFRPEWRYGVVAAVALSLGAETNAMETAQSRAISIGLGAIVGAVVSLIIWPDSAERRTARHLRAALEALARRLDTAIGAADGEKSDDGEVHSARFTSNLESARAASQAIRFADAKSLRARVEAAQHLYNSTLILIRVSGETNSATTDNDELHDIVEDFRQCGCELVAALADDSASDPQGASNKLREMVRKAQSLVVEGEAEEKGHLLRNALVFGMNEVTDSVEKLVASYGKEPETDDPPPVGSDSD